MGRGLTIVAVVLFYGRHRWPAYLMVGVWPFGFILGWRLAQAPPAVLAVGLVVGVTSFLGASGARTLHALGGWSTLLRPRSNGR